MVKVLKILGGIIMQLSKIILNILLLTFLVNNVYSSSDYNKAVDCYRSENYLKAIDFLVRELQSCPDCN